MVRSRTRSGGTERGAMPDSRTASILVIGYGNTLRRDDALGCLIADLVGCWQRPEVRTMSLAQLTPRGEDRASLVHAITPSVLLGLCKAAFGQCPGAWQVSVPGSDFSFGEGL